MIAMKTPEDYRDKGISPEERFRELAVTQDEMPRRYCSVHNREEFKYESLEHELHADVSLAAKDDTETENSV